MIQTDRRFLLGGVILASLAHAPGCFADASVTAPGPNNPNNIDQRNTPACAELVKAHDQLRHINKWSLFLTAVQLKFFPASLVHLESAEIPVPPERQVAPDRLSGANVIFSIEPPLRETAIVAGQRRRYEELSRQIDARRGDLMKVAGASTLPDCLKRASERAFDLPAYLALAAERSRLALVERVDEARDARRLLARLVTKLRLKWEIVSATDLMEVHQALRDESIRNVVFLSHGLDGGSLVDSSLTEYPKGFFSDLSPGLRSIAVFACHAGEIVPAYDLAAKLAAGPAQVTRRRLFFSRGTQLLSLGEVVPVKAFTSFMKKVDAVLARTETADDAPASAPLAPPNDGCAVRLERMAVRRGRIGVMLNGRFIGALGGALGGGGATASTASGSVVLPFPCAFEDRARDVLVLQSIGLLEAADVASTDFEITPLHEARPPARRELKNFRRADGSYLGTKLIYEY